MTALVSYDNHPSVMSLTTATATVVAVDVIFRANGAARRQRRVSGGLSAPDETARITR